MKIVTHTLTTLFLLFFCSLYCLGQDDCTLIFKGDWEFPKSYKAFDVFTDHYASRHRNPLVRFNSALNDNPDPSKEQLATYRYICENQEFLKSVLIDSSKIYFEDFIDEIPGNYEYLDEHEKKYSDPLVIEQLITPTIICILNEHKDGYAYYSIGGNCAWELDEGFGFLLFKDRIVEAETSYIVGHEYTAMVDNGTYQTEVSKLLVPQPGITLQPKPKLYSPHPKYGKLKPIEEYKNHSYVIDLIKYGYYEDIIKLHKKGMIDVQVLNGKYIHKNRLLTATHYNQMELVKYFIEQDTFDTRGLIQAAARNLNKEMVQYFLDNGIDINQRSLQHNSTALNNVYEHSNRRSHNPLDPKLKVDVEEFRTWLISKGAKTDEEIFEELIMQRDFSGIADFMKINRNFHKITSYTKDYLFKGDQEMAIVLFKNTHHNSEGMKLKAAVDFGNQKMVEYCLELGIDINESFREKSALAFLKNIIERRSERKDQYQALEKWMISKGAISTISEN